MWLKMSVRVWMLKPWDVCGELYKLLIVFLEVVIGAYGSLLVA
jgi:hypothetical protein